MSAREQMLGAIRRGLRRGELSGAAREAAEARLVQHPVNIVPRRSQVPREQQIELFAEGARAVHATVARVAEAEVAEAVGGYLATNNLPAAAVMAPDPALGRYDWSERPMLEIRRGLPRDADRVAITGAFAGVAETGTLIFTSGPDHPTSLNLLPETHVVILREDDIVGAYEEVFARLRARYGEGAMPRTVNTVTGPSRTADVEQQLELGAHGPRRMHILIVRD
ncbi:MAG: LUD domain-containing protein [Alphaproteobacteria bacterium]|nr:LUD domain-containing protein [Alphaproteobacteria bacterium]MCW5741091.1 LUD domain-containing protein [Alphaproteobacteria bacterium]